MGIFWLFVGFDWVEGKFVVLYSGWICIGDVKVDEGKFGVGVEFYVEVKVEVDLWYMF